MPSCGCKAACIRNCKCKKAGVKCTNMCSGCVGRTCNHSDFNDGIVWVQPFLIIHARNFYSFSESYIHTQSFTPLLWGGTGLPHPLKNHLKSDLFQDHGKIIEFREKLLKFAKEWKINGKIIEFWISHPWTNLWILKQTKLWLTTCSDKYVFYICNIY